MFTPDFESLTWEQRRQMISMLESLLAWAGDSLDLADAAREAARDTALHHPTSDAWEAAGDLYSQLQDLCRLAKRWSLL